MRESYPICLLGDYNQRIPKGSQPIEVYEALQEVLELGFVVPTANIVDNDGKQLIDHVAVTAGVNSEVVEIHPKVTDSGIKLSDHVGILLRLI